MTMPANVAALLAKLDPAAEGEMRAFIGGALRTQAVYVGVTPYEQVHGTSFFERLTDRGKEAEFASRMSGSVAGLAERLAALDTIASARRVVDVGGGHGALLAQLLRLHPRLEGVLFDREA